MQAGRTDTERPPGRDADQAKWVRTGQPKDKHCLSGWLTLVKASKQKKSKNFQCWHLEAQAWQTKAIGPSSPGPGRWGGNRSYRASSLWPSFVLGIKLQVIFNWLRTTTTEILLKLEAVRKNWFIPVLQRAGNHWERICQECSVLLSCNSPPPPAPPAHSSWCAVLLPCSLARPSPTSSRQEEWAPALRWLPSQGAHPNNQQAPLHQIWSLGDRQLLVAQFAKPSHCNLKQVKFNEVRPLKKVVKHCKAIILQLKKKKKKAVTVKVIFWLTGFTSPGTLSHASSSGCTVPQGAPSTHLPHTWPGFCIHSAICTPDPTPPHPHRPGHSSPRCDAWCDAWLCHYLEDFPLDNRSPHVYTPQLDTIYLCAYLMPVLSPWQQLPWCQNQVSADLLQGRWPWGWSDGLVRGPFPWSDRSVGCPSQMKRKLQEEDACVVSRAPCT